MFGGLYAQTDLKAAFEKGIKNFDKDPVAEIQTMAENLRFVGGEYGMLRNKAQTVEVAARLKSGKHQTQISDLNIKQSGTLGVATGIRNQTLSLPNGTVLTWKDAFTYVFEWKNNNWVITDLHHTKIDYQIGEDVAIRQVIEAETKAYHEANMTDWKAGWTNNAYTERQHESLKQLANVPYLKGEALVKAHEAFGKAHKATGQSFAISDFEAHIDGNTAWATYTQETLKADGTPDAKERALRILEKVNGKWKIALMSFSRF